MSYEGKTAKTAGESGSEAEKQNKPFSSGNFADTPSSDPFSDNPWGEQQESIFQNFGNEKPEEPSIFDEPEPEEEIQNAFDQAQEDFQKEVEEELSGEQDAYYNKQLHSHFNFNKKEKILEPLQEKWPIPKKYQNFSHNPDVEPKPFPENPFEGNTYILDYGFKQTLNEEKEKPDPALEAFGKALAEVGAQAAKELAHLNAATAKIDNQDLKAEAEIIKERAQEFTLETLQKISETVHNESGWFENPETGNRYFIKFYTDPDQARAEYIANAIYAKLGIPAASAELAMIGGKLALVRKEIQGERKIALAEHKKSQDVLNGFLADAYLGNQHVLGLGFQNIVRGEDGHDYRTANGESFMFRARGRKKEFVSDAVPELDAMRDQRKRGPSIAFSAVSDKDIETQARALIERLKGSDIDVIIEQSGMQGENAEKIRTALKDRRKCLIRRFAVYPIERIPIAIDKLLEQMERLRGIELRPRVGLLADSDKIENQQVDIIDATDENRYEINFKLTEKHAAIIQAKLEDLQSLNRGGVTNGMIEYGKRTKEGGSFELSNAWVIKKDGVEIKISRGNKGGRCSNQNCTVNHQAQPIRSALGLVHIEILRGSNFSKEEMSTKINEIFIDLLDIPEGLAPPEVSAEREYKKARYLWHHKLDPQETIEDWDVIEPRLKREEVFPGYFTIVDKGRHAEYAGISPHAVYHQLYSDEALVSVIKAGGLLCTHERYRRGLIVDGSSSIDDLNKGGGDSVFTRIITDAAVSSSGSEGHGFYGSLYLVFDSSMLDRTDWYAYGMDKYGATTPHEFVTRQSPKEALESQKTNYESSNEQMFRLGIPTKQVKAIVCRDSGARAEWEKALRKARISEVGGESVEVLLQQGVAKLRTALEKAGIDVIGRRPVEEVVNEVKAEGGKKQARAGFSYLILEKEWEKLKGLGRWSTLDEFFEQDAESIVASLKEAGITGFGAQSVEYILEYYGRGQKLSEDLQRMGIETIDGTNVRDFIFYNSNSRILSSLKELGITEVYRATPDSVMRSIKDEDIARVKSALVNTLSVELKYYNGRKYYDAREEIRYARTIEDMVAILKKHGIEKVGAVLIEELPNEYRDQILAKLREGGITEINGRPIEDVVVSAKKISDFIDIANDRPLRSMKKHETE